MKQGQRLFTVMVLNEDIGYENKDKDYIDSDDTERRHRLLNKDKDYTQ